MKKKGRRICGTIGLVLSLALAGATVVYGAMFDKNAVGKAKKAFGGTSTGNVFKREGFNETKTLIDETEGVLLGTKKDGTYKSFSLNWTQRATFPWTEGQKEYTIDHLFEYSFFTDEDYTYLKCTGWDMRERTVTISADEYVLDKTTSVWYKRTNSYAGTGTVTDVPLLDKAEWKIDEAPVNILNFEFKRNSFTSISDTNKLYLDPTGTFYFKDTANLANYGENSEAEVRFTVGIAPTIVRSFYKANEKQRVTDTFNYFNLNNTKVSRPDSLKTFMEAK